MLFTSRAAPDLGGAIEYVITLAHEGPQRVKLRCIGKVLRSERTYMAGEERRGYEIAVTLERYEFVRAS